MLRLIAVTDPNGRTTRYEYDLLGRRIAEIEPLGNVVRFGYDSLGNLVSKTDAASRTTTYQYDDLSRRIGVIDSTGGAVLTTYTSVGQMANITDPLGVTTTYVYDAAGRLARTVSPDSGTTALSYNADGTLESKIYAKGTLISYSYNTAGRLTLVSFPDGLQNVSYGYDTVTAENGKGRLTSMTDPSGTTFYHYDVAARFVREVKSILGVRKPSPFLWAEIWPIVVATAVPFLLVMKQPDLGTALIIAGIFIIMLFVAGVDVRLFAWTAGGGIAVAGALFGLNVLGVFNPLKFLHAYQIKRILVLFDPDLDPLGAGYHINQAKIAIGSGGLTGKGFQGGRRAA